MSFSKALTIEKFSNFEFQSYFKNLNFTKVAIAACSGAIKVYYKNLSIKINSKAAHTFCLNRITQSPFKRQFQQKPPELESGESADRLRTNFFGFLIQK
jgi:hypothetical protein